MKKFLSLLLVALMTFSLVGCGEKKTNEPTPDDSGIETTTTVPNVPNTGTDTASTTDTTNTTGSENDSGGTTQPTVPSSLPANSPPIMDDGPLVVVDSDIGITLSDSTKPEETKPTVPAGPQEMVVSDSFANTVPGAYVKRGDKLYSAGFAISLEASSKYGIGLQYNDVAMLYNSNKYGILAFGNVPVLELSDGDEMRTYGVSSISLWKTELIGHSLWACEATELQDTTVVFVGQYYKDAVTLNGQEKQLTLEDVSGNVVSMSDVHDLVADQTYTLSWFTGTTYHEYKVPATGLYYKRPDQNATYRFEGTLDKAGYATYDLSDVEPGIYRVVCNTFSGSPGMIRIP